MTAIVDVKGSAVSFRVGELFHHYFRRALDLEQALAPLAHRETSRFVGVLLDCEEAFGIDLDVDIAVAQGTVRGMIAWIEARALQCRSAAWRAAVFPGAQVIDLAAARSARPA